MLSETVLGGCPRGGTSSWRCAPPLNHHPLGEVVDECWHSHSHYLHCALPSTSLARLPAQPPPLCRRCSTYKIYLFYSTHLLLQLRLARLVQLGRPHAHLQTHHGPVLIQESLVWDSIKPVSTSALNFNKKPLAINKKTEPPATWGGWQGPLIHSEPVLTLPCPFSLSLSLTCSSWYMASRVRIAAASRSRLACSGERPRIAMSDFAATDVWDEIKPISNCCFSVKCQN